MAKFKKGDILVPKPFYKGFERLTVIDTDGKTYRCGILKGTATFSVSALEEYYMLAKEEGTEQKGRRNDEVHERTSSETDNTVQRL